MASGYPARSLLPARSSPANILHGPKCSRKREVLWALGLIGGRRQNSSDKALPPESEECSQGRPHSPTEHTSEIRYILVLFCRVSGSLNESSQICSVAGKKCQLLFRVKSKSPGVNSPFAKTQTAYRNQKSSEFCSVFSDCLWPSVVQSKGLPESLCG